jgi:hypothetical protein
METATLNKQTVEHIWSLLGLGSAQSAGWGQYDTEHKPGSGYIFGYGHRHADGHKTAGVTIYNAEGAQTSIDPATKQNVLEALIEMGITETEWSV